MKTLILLLAIFSFLPGAHAGVSELGLSFSKNSSRINEFNFTKRDYITGSYSYYLGAASAIEFSYTSGRYENSSGSNSSDVSKILGIFEFFGIDLVYGFADRKAQFQPFIKLGALYMDKEFFLNPTNLSTNPTSSQCGIAPSAGVGFKIRLTQTFSFKFNMDGSTQPLGNKCEATSAADETTNIDYSAKAGISWFF